MVEQPKFAISPSDTDLDNLPRDLQFFPCRNDHPVLLAREDIERFNRDGFLSRLRIFDREEIARHRAYFDQLLEQTLAAGGDSYSISTAHLKHGRVYDLLTHPRIVAHVKDLLGENVVAWGSHYFCKLPGDGKAVAWHQDASYWPLSPSKAVTVWLAIDDADQQNACMQFVSGSHRFGRIAHQQSSETSVLDREIVDAEKYGHIVDLELPAGEISIHSDLLLHGSGANNSARRRCGLTLRYCTADVRAGLDWNQKGVLVSGSDPSGHWANPLRPETD
jgi:ectoine hydroxylase-related dioxygenase (phytanoyl-CoA dioxygenase family)